MRIGDRHIREMAARFEEIDNRFELMRWIDGEIVANALSLDRALSEILYRSATCMGATAASSFAIMDRSAVRFSEPSGRLQRAKLHCVDDDTLSSTTAIGIHTSVDHGIASLFIPIHSKVISLRIILVLQGPWFGGDTSVFHQPDVMEFAEMLANQCGILMGSKISMHFEKVREAASRTFFEFRLEPQRCWFQMAGHVLGFFPQWRALKLTQSTQAQLLTYDGNRETIQLRAGTDQDVPSRAQELLIKQTICGIVIEQSINGTPIRPLFVNPTDEEYSNRYSQFLFKENIPQGELVVPIFERESGNVIGLVNVENQLPNQFSDIHINILQVAAAYISPFVNALIQEEAAQRARDVNHLYTLHNILSKMSKIYKHKLGNRTQVAKVALELLQGAENRLSIDEIEWFRELQDAVTSFTELSESFATGLPNYVRHGAMQPLPLIQNAIGDFKAKKMQGSDSPEANPDIDIKVENFLEDNPEDNIRIFASALLSEHIYNLLVNSMIAIRDRQELGEIDRGRIDIRMRLETPTDRRNKENSYPFVLIEFQDNGGGLSEKAEANWGKAGETTRRDRGGTGLGVSSTIDYVTGLGGSVGKHNDPGVGLTVMLYVPVYVEAVHGPRAAKLNFGSGRGRTENE